jgi:hypothetical protein
LLESKGGARMSSDTLFAILGISFSAAIILATASITICAIIDFKNNRGELGPRKIPKGAVVFTREEFDAYPKRIIAAYESGYRESKNMVIKKTAEKFAERLSEEDCSIPIKDDFIIITRKTIDEICKEFTEGRDEKG